VIDWFPIRLSFAVATAATLIALVAGSALAWLLARKNFPGRNLIDALVTLPLVLPPTVLGYYCWSCSAHDRRSAHFWIARLVFD
jgi:molybdate transport system permease protein